MIILIKKSYLTNSTPKMIKPVKKLGIEKKNVLNLVRTIYKNTHIKLYLMTQQFHRYLAPKVKKICPHKNLHMNIQNSIISNSRKCREKTQMPSTDEGP